MNLLDELLLETCSFADALLAESTTSQASVFFLDCRGRATCLALARALTEHLGAEGRLAHVVAPEPHLPRRGNLRFARDVDAIWGPGYFRASVVAQGFPEITPELLSQRASAFDAGAGSLWRKINMTTFVGEALDVNTRLAAALNGTPSHEKGHLVVCNPDLEDFQVFNVLMATVSQATRAQSDRTAIWVLFDETNARQGSAQRLFQSFAETQAESVRRLPCPPPSPRGLEKVLARHMSHAEATDKAVECVMRLRLQQGLKLAPGDRFEPSAWLKTIGEVCPSFDVPIEEFPENPEEPPLATDSQGFEERLNEALRAVSVEELQTLLCADREKFRDSGCLQFLYLVSLSLSLVQADISWIFDDPEVRAALMESRMNAALALYPVISLSQEDLKTRILEEMFPSCIETLPEAAIQTIHSWALIAYKIDNKEILERLPRFVAQWDVLAAGCMERNERLAMRLVLELMLAGVLPLERYPPGWTSRLLDEARYWNANIASFVKACPQFPTSVDVDASILQERTNQTVDLAQFGLASLRVRQKTSMYTRLGISLTNVAEEAANAGRYEEALRHLQFAKSIADYNTSVTQGQEASFRFSTAMALASMLRSEAHGGIIPADCVPRIFQHLQMASNVGNPDWRFGQLSDSSLALFFACSPRAFHENLEKLLVLAPETPAGEEVQRVRFLLAKVLAHTEAVAERSPQSLPCDIIERGCRAGAEEPLRALLKRHEESPSIFTALGRVIQALRVREGEAQALREAMQFHATTTRHNLLLASLLLRATTHARRNGVCRAEAVSPIDVELRTRFFWAWGEGWTSSLRRRQFLHSPLLVEFAGTPEVLAASALENHVADAIHVLSRIRLAQELCEYASLVFLCTVPVQEVYFACREGDGTWCVTTCTRRRPQETGFWRDRCSGFRWETRRASNAEVETRIPARDSWTPGAHSVFYSSRNLALELVLPQGIMPSEIVSLMVESMVARAFLEAVGVAKVSCDLNRECEQRERECKAYAQSQAANALQLSEQLHAQREALKESNAKLRELDDLKSRFLANLTHELRTPLTISIGTLESLAARNASAEGHKLIAIGIRAQKQLLNVVNDLLDNARIEANRMETTPTDLLLGATAQDMAALFQAEAERLGISLQVEVGDGQASAHVDGNHLERILTNLLSNALKFTPRGGRVTIACGGENEAWVSVEDTGTGLEPEELSELFGRFSHSRKAQSLEQMGSGLGLSLVHELVRINGGNIEVKSRPGQGSRFTVHLPPGRGEARHAPHRPPSVTAPLPCPEPLLVPLHPETEKADCPHVLVAEDSPEIRALIHALLEPHFNVHFAQDGAQALERFGSREFACVISDYMMPHADGIAFLRSVRSHPHRQATPFLLITARTDDETRNLAFESGVSDFIAKPFSGQELLLRVKNLVELERLRQTTQAAHALHALADLSLAISHELNNPMQILALIMEELEDELASDSPEVGRAFAKARECIGRMKHRVSALQMLKKYAHDATRVPTLEEILGAHSQGSWMR